MDMLPQHTTSYEDIIHCSNGFNVLLKQPRSQTVLTSSVWSLVVCKYRGGRPGRSGHVRLHQVDKII